MRRRCILRFNFSKMQTGGSDSSVKKALESLCRINGWNYGVVWRFDQRNSLLLTMEDAYSEEHMGFMIDNMLLQVHMLSNGIVGQTAFTKKHRWMFLDARSRGQIPSGSNENQHVFRDDFEIHHQFSSGIETVALISVEPRGVVQFGSTQKIPESMEFVDQTKTLFREIENDGTKILPDSTPSSSRNEIYGPNGWFGSLMSSGNLADIPRLSLFSSDHGSMNSSHLRNQMHRASTKNPSKLSSMSNTWLHEALGCISTCSSGQSTLTSFEQQLPHETRLTGKTNSLTCYGNAVQNFQDLTFGSVLSTKGLVDMENESTSQMEVSFVSSGLDGTEFLINTPLNNPANSAQSSIANTFHADGNKDFLGNFGVENELLDSLGEDFEWVEGLEADDFLNDILMPVESNDHLDFSEDTLECISDQTVDSILDPPEKLFSKLGLEQFVGGAACSSNSIASSSLEDELLPSDSKRRKGSCSDSGDQMQLTSLPLHNLEKNKEVIRKSEVDSRVGESYSTTSGSSVAASQPKKRKESTKVYKKRARAGSQRPAPHRVHMTKCFSELKKLVPNSAKMSQISLLAQTIKHMRFLQSVTAQAEKLKQPEELKGYGMALRDNSSNSAYMWESEVEAQIMVDPVDVKDINPPGQKLIKMLCEEKGLFLEIVDIVQGIGLTILKGVMEVRENKIWACFIVEAEANRYVTKHDIYASLHQLLFRKATSETDSITDQLANVVNGGIPLFNNYHQDLLPLPHQLG